MIIIIAVIIFGSLYRISLKVNGLGIILFKGGLSELSSPEQATVEQWFFEEGDAVSPGAVILSIKSHVPPFKSIDIKAVDAALIAEIIAYPGTKVDAGDALAFLSSHGDKRSDLELIGFVSSLDGHKLRPGMKVSIVPSISDSYREGVLLGEIRRVGKLPASKSAISSLVKIPELAKYIRSRIEAEPFLVVISLLRDEHHVSGYQWRGQGSRFPLDSGLIAYFQAEYDERTLLQMYWPWLHLRFWEVPRW
ncbi:MAG: hypothetical protein BWZ03_00327 [bacterium ADurb.BinA186]|nr:MAG: hypothetical protein BWZ03_00327 [bacterium ADurb.BinA186]